MACPKCGSESFSKHGQDKDGHQRYKCRECKKTWFDKPEGPLGAMRVPLADAVKCLQLLLDGMSVRAVERFMGINRTTLCDLLVRVGENCQRLLEKQLRRVHVHDLQIDEVWSFIGAKQKTCDRLHFGPERGDCYTYIALERDSKLIVHHRVGKRDDGNTREFIHDLAQTVVGKFQVSTDGFTAYQTCIPNSFSPLVVDFGVIVKEFGKPDPTEQRRYSPAPIVRVKRKPMMGRPNVNRICTSHVERGNLTIRMTCRRWTRLTNAFSKSWRHHEAAMSLFIAFYDFVRPHSSIGTTPAHKHGVADHAWTLEELIVASAAA